MEKNEKKDVQVLSDGVELWSIKAPEFISSSLSSVQQKQKLCDDIWIILIIEIKEN